MEVDGILKVFVFTGGPIIYHIHYNESKGELSSFSSNALTKPAGINVVVNC